MAVGARDGLAFTTKLDAPPLLVAERFRITPPDGEIRRQTVCRVLGIPRTAGKVAPAPRAVAKLNSMAFGAR
jgi:hypothetical protein